MGKKRLVGDHFAGLINPHKENFFAHLRGYVQDETLLGKIEKMENNLARLLHTDSYVEVVEKDAENHIPSQQETYLQGIRDGLTLASAIRLSGVVLVKQE